MVTPNTISTFHGEGSTSYVPSYTKYKSPTANNLIGTIGDEYQNHNITDPQYTHVQYKLDGEDDEKDNTTGYEKLTDKDLQDRINNKPDFMDSRVPYGEFTQRKEAQDRTHKALLQEQQNRSKKTANK